MSHHHAVGLEHQQWLEQDISPAGVAIVTALLDGVDPGQHLNPGKIVGGGDDVPKTGGRPVDVDVSDEGARHDRVEETRS